MADIKMSDVFELPLKSVEYQNQIVDKNKMELLFADFHNYEKDALIAAINTYDQNQERIKKLEVALDKLASEASECDGWESFPQSWIDEAFNVLDER